MASSSRTGKLGSTTNTRTVTSLDAQLADERGSTSMRRNTNPLARGRLAVLIHHYG